MLMSCCAPCISFAYIFNIYLCGLLHNSAASVHLYNERTVGNASDIPDMEYEQLESTGM
ncbi:hypothetical protein BIFBRE_03635 [Bifidobacterium breve DSM 20213 = JCM 1192]|uniref:Uncharacterized protein n=1 Tax=Bifidobacterium breve DSM 20213 = JCM 1192 TaxID=518634 RepID=D4BNI6_BIFBR|nr:hypothetical protein BIFBRE_03635 [Bifidobacterium breve DSM 20213 = JCM 1192]